MSALKSSGTVWMETHLMMILGLVPLRHLQKTEALLLLLGHSLELAPEAATPTLLDLLAMHGRSRPVGQDLVGKELGDWFGFLISLSGSGSTVAVCACCHQGGDVVQVCKLAGALPLCVVAAWTGIVWRNCLERMSRTCLDAFSVALQSDGLTMSLVSSPRRIT
jgi:hypothetical protein